MQSWEGVPAQGPAEKEKIARELEAMALTMEPGLASSEQEPEVLRQLARIIFGDKPADAIAMAVAQGDQTVIDEYVSKVDQRIAAMESDPGSRTQSYVNDMKNFRKILTEPKLI